MADETSSEPLSPSSAENIIQFHDEDLDILNLDAVHRDSAGFEKEVPFNFSTSHGFRLDGDDDENAEDLSPDGILDERTIELALSNFGKTADGSSYAYLNLKVPGFRLKDISVLSDYLCIQCLDVSHNQLTDLSALGNLTSLIELNASHNNLTTVLDFHPPRNLKVVDLSFNKIETIGDVSVHQSLTCLILDHNQISRIEGVSQCKQLRQLSLEHNLLSRIEGVNDLPLKRLNVMYNKIQIIENLETLTRLQEIVLAGNRIRSLKGLENHPVLDTIDVEDNEVIDIMELKHLKDLRILRSINLLQNPIQEIYDYRSCVIFELPMLTTLDLKKVDASEKVAAKNRYSPQDSIIAQRDHRLNMVYSFFQPHTVLDSTLQSADTPYPMLVLVGPQGSGKRGLAMKLVQEFPDFFGYGISHTTRPPYASEENGREYHFVTTEEFEALHLKGKFVQTALIQGHLYGLSLDSIEVVAREGLACVVHMELEGVLSLKMTYHEPRYVLTMPLNRFAQEAHLREKNVYTEREIAAALSRAGRYVVTNQNHPGFFDMFINTNDLIEAYFRLRRLVMDYLGLTSVEESDSPMRHTEGLSRATGDQADKSNGGIRAWSKTSGPTSATQGQLAALGTPANRRRTNKNANQGVSGRGIVEAESLKKRKSAAREIISGYRSSSGLNAIGKTPRGDELGADDRQDSTGVSGATHPTALHHDAGSETSESAAKSSASRLSDLRAATPMQGEGEGAGEADPLEVAEAVLDRLEFLSSGDDSMQRSLGLAGPRPDSGSRVILPPIGTPPVAIPEY